MTSIVGDGGTTTTGQERRRRRRRRPLAYATAMAVGLVAIAMSSSAVHADDPEPAAPVGYASQDGTEVEMLAGPACVVADHVDEVCEPAAERWWENAPALTSGPHGTVTVRWATDADPEEVDVRIRTYGDGPGPLGLTATATAISDCGNPCTIEHVDVSTSGGVTYLVRAYWDETSYKNYAFTLKG